MCCGLNETSAEPNALGYHARLTKNGPMYVELFKEKLIQHMHIFSCTIFMQDGAPCHLSKVATEEKQDICVGMAQDSPNLNSVENLWTVMNDKVAYQRPPSVENRRQAIKEVWVTEITKEWAYCEYLASSMSRRIQAVID